MESICRCSWVDPKDEILVRYHDDEWGVPVHDDRKLFEFLLLETFQAGLSWTCILKKREGFRRAFDEFDPVKIACYEEEKLNRLAEDPEIVRNRLKIRSAVQNARVFLEIQKEQGSFSAYLWGFTGGTSIRECGPVTSPLSDRISKDLRRRGMKFVGSTTVYAYLQAAGVIWGHEDGCFLGKYGR